MKKAPPCVALIVPEHITPFHFAIPFTVFSAVVDGKRLFDLQIVGTGAHRAPPRDGFSIVPSQDISGARDADIVVVPFWRDLDVPPNRETIDTLVAAHRRGARIVGLCYGAYALAYSGLLKGKRASTHWLAEADFSTRFPGTKLDLNALYVEEDRLITSAGSGAGLDCCLHIVREYYGSKIANKLARILVMPPHREGGQAQFIEQPIAATSQNSKINQMLDYLRSHLEAAHSIDELATRAAMSRRTFTRQFNKATGSSLVEWLVNERLRRSRDLLETSSLSIEQIACRAGFATPLSFRKHFKSRFHVSPSDWRRTFGTSQGL